jgi:hypothetical protein
VAALQDLYERDLARRLRAEFGELPGMRLTFEQATRLTATDAITCAHALRRLTATGFLEKRGGVYRRTDRMRAA